MGCKFKADSKIEFMLSFKFLTVFLTFWIQYLFCVVVLGSKFTLYFIIFYLILPLFCPNAQGLYIVSRGSMLSFVCGLPNIYLHILANFFAISYPRNIRYMNRDKGHLWSCADKIHLISSIILSTLIHILTQIPTSL